MERKPNYLFSLLVVLTGEERLLLQSLDLRGKEKALFELYYSSLASEAPTKEEVAAKLDISGTHFDKINSLLLKRCYDVLVPTGGSDLWLFLRQKNLRRHFYHQLALEERELIRSGDQQALAAFYYSGFENIHQTTFQNYDPKIARRYMERYFELKTEVTPSERLMIEGRLIRQEIINGTALGMQQKQKEKFYDELIRLEQLIPSVDSPEPIAQFYLAFALYYKSVAIDPKKNRENLERAHEVILGHPTVFILEDDVLLRCMIGDTYYQDSEFDTAFSIYQTVFSEFESLLKNQFFFCSSYVQLAAITKHFAEAEAILGQLFAEHLNDDDGGQAAATAAISYAEFALHQGDLERAKHYIDLGFRHNDKNLLVAFEIKLRKLETIYFALKGDYLFAETLVAKHLKYLQSRGYTLAKSLHGWFFKLVTAIIDEKTHSKKLSQPLETRYNEVRNGFSAIHGKLIEQLRTTK